MENTSSEIYETFSGRIDRLSSEALTARMGEHTYHSVERVLLDVSSPGGKVESAIALHEKLRSVRFELVTRAVDQVDSMGLMLYLAGDRRLAFPEVTFLMHPITLETPTRWPTAAPWLNIEDIRKLRTKVEQSSAHSKLSTELDLAVVRLAREEQRSVKIFVERTNLTYPQVQTLVQRAQPISATDALALGIVHEVIPARKA